MKGFLYKEVDGNWMVECWTNPTKYPLHPIDEKHAIDSVEVQFEIVKINKMGRQVDPMDLTQNQSGCFWVAKLAPNFKEVAEKCIHQELFTDKIETDKIFYHSIERKEEEDWNDIEGKFCSYIDGTASSHQEVSDFIEWLKKNYNIPIEKKK